MSAAVRRLGGAAVTASSGSSLSSAAQIVRDWDQAELEYGEVSSRMAVAVGDGAVANPAHTQGLFEECRKGVVAFSKELVKQICITENSAGVSFPASSGFWPFWFCHFRGSFFQGIHWV